MLPVTIRRVAKLDMNEWQFLLTEQAGPLCTAVEAVGADPRPADIDRLRKAYPDQPVAAALELVMARRRARQKFPTAASLLCDRQGVEQATSAQVADYKARRFGDGPVMDLCCGIGGDAMSLARRGETIGVDSSDVRALMCRHNAGIDVRCQDVADLVVETPLVHIDPARRDEATGRRSWSLADLQPGLETIASISGQCDGAAIKLGPGIPRELTLPDPHATVEFIAEGSALVQAVVWCGSLATPGASRRATDIARGISIEGIPLSLPQRSTPGSHLMVPHPAIERSQLMANVLDRCAYGELAPGLGILSAEEPFDSPWFEEFEILETLPPREDRVGRWLSQYGAGAVVVRSRDQAIDAEGWSRRLQGTGEEEVVLFGLRLGKKIRVFATRRLSQPGSSAS